MATKTISITEGAYDILDSWRGKHDSFSKAIVKIGRRRLIDFAGVWSEKTAKVVEKNISEMRKRDIKDREKRIREIAKSF